MSGKHMKISPEKVREMASGLGITAQRGTASAGYYAARWVATRNGTVVATTGDCEANVLRAALVRVLREASCTGCPVHEDRTPDTGPRLEWLRADGHVEVMDREKGPCPLCGEPVEDHRRRIGGYRNEGARGSTIYVLDKPCRIRSSVAKRRRLAELEAKVGTRSATTSESDD